MKSPCIVLLSTLLACSIGTGQIPRLMSHQGFIADSTGTGVTGSLPMTFRMFNDSTGGSPILTAIYPGMTVTKGVFSVNLDVSTLNFSSQYWLETEVNGQTLAPRTRLTSAPYSLRALIADTADYARTASSDVGWALAGNAGTVDGADFLGTIDNVPLSFRVSDTLSGRIDHTGIWENTYFGFGAGSSGIEASENAFYGFGAGATNTFGVGNVGIGHNALRSNTDGSENIAIGNNAMFVNTSGYNNVAVGDQALWLNEEGESNVGLGSSALRVNTLGYENVAVGTAAMNANTLGFENTAVGDKSLQANTTGSQITVIGVNADVSSGALTNATAIGAHTVVGSSNSLVLGNNANVGIGTSNPGASNLLDLVSNSKGLVVPRMTKVQRDAIASPVAGMIIYQTDSTPGIRVYNGSNWVRFSETAD